MHSRTAAVVGSSLLVHLGMATVLVFAGSRAVVYAPRRAPIKVAVVTEPPKPKAVEPPKVEPVKPPPPKPVQKPKPKPLPKIKTERPPDKPPVANAKPVQGLSPTALSPSSHGISVPTGNTLMAQDDGKRLKAADVQGLAQQDLSADARLIRSSFTKPSYTEAALNSGLEGTFTVDVLVDAKGNVKDVELPRKVGFGMDDRIAEAIRSARFEPKKDKLGRSLEGWAEVKIRLEMP